MGLHNSFQCSFVLTTESHNFHSFKVLRIKQILLRYLVGQFVFGKMNCLVKDLSLIHFGVTSSEFSLKFCLATLCLCFLYFLASFARSPDGLASLGHHRFQGGSDGEC